MKKTVSVRVDKESIKQLRDARPELAALKDAPLVNLILREALVPDSRGKEWAERFRHQMGEEEEEGSKTDE